MGSYISGHAVTLRSRPVAHITPSLSTQPHTLTLYDTEFVASLCLTYEGSSVPRQLGVSVSLVLDASRVISSPRAFFPSSRSPSLSSKILPLP